MSTQTLSFNITGSSIESADVFIAADSVNYAEAQFYFDESWATLYKTAVFRKDENVYHVVLQDDKCKIPFEVLVDGIMYVSCFGVFNEKRATTIELPIQVQKSGYVMCIPQEPTPDPYNFFLSEVTGKANEAEDSAVKTESFANSASDYSSAAQKSLDTINILAEVVKTAEQRVCEWTDATHMAKQSAEESKNNAALSAQEAKEFAETTLQSIEQHNSNTSISHPDIRALANEAKDIAKGKANSISFETEEQLKAWIRGEYERADGKTVSDLNVGDNLYVIELGVPDYWWDGEEAQPLGAEKPALSEYVKKEELEAQLSGVVIKEVSETEYKEALENNTVDAGAIYFVYGEEE